MLKLTTSASKMSVSTTGNWHGQSDIWRLRSTMSGHLSSKGPRGPIFDIYVQPVFIPVTLGTHVFCDPIRNLCQCLTMFDYGFHGFSVDGMIKPLVTWKTTLKKDGRSLAHPRFLACPCTAFTDAQDAATKAEDDGGPGWDLDMHGPKTMVSCMFFKPSQ